MHTQDLSLVYLCLLALAVVISAYSSDVNSQLQVLRKIERILSPVKRDKKCAKEEAARAGYNDVEKDDGLSVYSKLMHYYLKKKQPWLMLPNNAFCFQKQCLRDTDCCRTYNICDNLAHVCIDCWYGYPCKTSSDCCERYPSCDPSNRCIDQDTETVKRLNWAK